MKEVIDDTEYDDQYTPVEISKSEGYYKDVPTIHYSITVEADFDEEFEEIIESFDLEISGYTLEGIILARIEQENEALIEHIVSFDTEENQHKIAALIQQLCTSKKIFKKTIKDNLEEIRNRYS